MKSIKYLLTSLCLLATPVQATTNEVMLDMVEWITENSKYEYSGQKLPWVEVRTQQEICEVLFETPPQPCPALAYYDDTINAIFLSPDPIGGMVQEKFIEVILFHELVHFLQYVNEEHKNVECLNALERDAYKLQDAYIEEMGWPDEQRPNMLFAYVISACAREPAWPEQ